MPRNERPDDEEGARERLAAARSTRAKRRRESRVVHPFAAAPGTGLRSRPGASSAARGDELEAAVRHLETGWKTGQGAQERDGEPVCRTCRRVRADPGSWRLRLS